MINLIKMLLISLVGERKLHLILNDLSLHGQFDDVSAFEAAINRVMILRQLAGRFGRELHCHRNMVQAKVTHNLNMLQVVQALDQEKKRALMQWLTRIGPFWEDERSHSSDDYLECEGVVVTDTAIGEAALCNIRGQDHRLASFTPSSWLRSPLSVTWTPDACESQLAAVMNHWAEDDLKQVLDNASAVISSWEQLSAACRLRFGNLFFSDNCFEPLQGHPFVNGAADRIVELLDVLDRFKVCFDANGQRTALGQEIYQNHFTGDKAWFSDSSDLEKNDFERKLTFLHPENRAATLFCSWHGKVKTPQIRIHFSWPVSANIPLYVVYIGEKLTKR